ncbi:MAG: ribosome maturation factor RimM [Clostridia bacterium]
MNSVLIGQIVNIHGIKGEIKVYPYTDNVYNLCNLKEVFLDEDLKKCCIVKSARVHKEMLLMQIDGIDDANSALKYKGEYIYISKKSLPKLENDEYYIEDLVGFEVYDKDEKKIGKLSYIFNTGANDIYEIDTLDKTKIYLPAIHDVIKKIDIENKKIYVEIMEGLI